MRNGSGGAQVGKRRLFYVLGAPANPMYGA